MNKKETTLRFRGNKDCVGKQVWGKTIGLLRNGTVVDTFGIIVGRYRRIETDGGVHKDLQEILIYIP